MLGTIKTLSRAQVRKLVIKSFAIICITLFIGYGLFVSRNLIMGPEITITEPQNGSATTSSYIHISGNVLRIKEVSLNNRPITVSLTGDFNETVTLFPGYNIFVFSAMDKFNRSITKQIGVVKLGK